VITTVTRDRNPTFANPAAAAEVRRVVTALQEVQAVTHAWVLMPDHLHWLLELGAELSLGSLVQGLKSRSAIAINKAIGSVGPVWQAGYYDHRVRQQEDLLRQARYLIENPLRKQLVDRVEDYPHWWCRWSGRGDGTV
jgi:putative transposase